MGINFNDVPKGILAVTKPVVLGSRVNSPDLRPLTAARRRDALRERLDVGVGDANVKEPTLPVLQGGLPLLMRRIKKLKKLNSDPIQPKPYGLGASH